MVFNVINLGLCVMIHPTWNVVLLTIVRAFYPLTLFIPVHPFIIHLGENLIDATDIEVIRFTQDISYNDYHRYDKIFDGIYTIALTIYLLVLYKKFWFARWVVPFGFVRIIGLIVYESTNNRLFLVIFPDFFNELAAIFFFLDFVRLDHIFRRVKYVVILLVGVIITKLMQEIQHHTSIDNGWLLAPYRGFIIVLIFAVGFFRVPNFSRRVYFTQKEIEQESEYYKPIIVDGIVWKTPRKTIQVRKIEEKRRRRRRINPRLQYQFLPTDTINVACRA